MLTARPRRPVRARTARSCAALVAAGALVLAGCTAGDDGAPTATVSTPAPSPTGSPTTDVPAEPAPTSTESPTDAPEPSPTGVAVGEVVDGFPLDVVPVLPDAEVTLSNVVEQDGGGRQVALAGRTTQAVDDVVAFYTDALTAQGFTAGAPPAVEGASSTTFARGDDAADLLTLTVTGADGLQDFSIGGRLA